MIALTDCGLGRKNQVHPRKFRWGLPRRWIFKLARESRTERSSGAARGVSERWGEAQPARAGDLRGARGVRVGGGGGEG